MVLLVYTDLQVGILSVFLTHPVALLQGFPLLAFLGHSRRYPKVVGMDLALWDRDLGLDIIDSTRWLSELRLVIMRLLLEFCK